MTIRRRYCLEVSRHIRAEKTADKSSEDIQARAAAFKKALQTTGSTLRRLPAAFADTLIMHMQIKDNITVEELAYLTGLESRTISRLRNSEQRPTLKNIVILSIALHLEPVYSADLLRKAGYILTNSEQDVAYSLLLHYYYQCSLAECNGILKAMGLKPLGPK